MESLLLREQKQSHSSARVVIEMSFQNGEQKARRRSTIHRSRKSQGKTDRCLSYLAASAEHVLEQLVAHRTRPRCPIYL